MKITNEAIQELERSAMLARGNLSIKTLERDHKIRDLVTLYETEVTAKVPA